MKVRFPLYLQTMGFLLLHVLVISLILVALFNSHFGMGWDALLSSPLGDRMESISWMIHQQAKTRPRANWDQTLAEFGKFYGVKFYIFTRQGQQVAGEQIQLPHSLLEQLTRRNRGMANAGSGHAAGSVPSPSGDYPASVLSAGGRERYTHGRVLVRTQNPDYFWIGVRFGVPVAEGTPNSIKGVDGCFIPGALVAATPSLWHSKLFFDLNTVAALVGGLLLVSILLWWPFVYSITRAMADLTSMTDRIAQGKFDARVKVSRPDEIGRLAAAVNSMAEQIETYVAGQKRFLGDTAHELCSPVSRLQVALELLDGSGQENVLADVREDVAEMSTLINELLAFSKAGLKGRDVPLEPVTLAPTFKNVLAKTATESLVSISIPDALSVLGDQVLLERAFGNVIRNAVRYAAADGPITVTAAREDEQVVITICDSGPGVPPAALKLLGQPFYRPEPSRSRDSGGFGLGLAIVKTCIESCGGRLRIENRQPRGLQVEIMLNNAETPADSAIPAVAITN
jgi:two-component system sensor histidine kinase CpxA